MLFMLDQTVNTDLVEPEVLDPLNMWALGARPAMSPE